MCLFSILFSLSNLTHSTVCTSICVKCAKTTSATVHVEHDGLLLLWIRDDSSFTCMGVGVTFRSQRYTLHSPSMSTWPAFYWDECPLLLPTHWRSISKYRKKTLNIEWDENLSASSTAELSDFRTFRALFTSVKFDGSIVKSNTQ